jgi:hypothetical protein
MGTKPKQKKSIFESELCKPDKDGWCSWDVDYKGLPPSGMIIKLAKDTKGKDGDSS